MQHSQKARPQQKNPDNITGVGQIKITFYTDPLCCWSWALERHWRLLLKNYPDDISYRYVMGGMIPHWDGYNDPLNSVSKPIQMGPVWMHASEVTNVKMNYNIWHNDPPTSSYPACIAVKTAGLQSEATSEKYLFKIRQALMEDGENISKREVLLAIAEKLDDEEFDFKKFERDWDSGKGKESFRNDLQKTRFHSIGRFPTLTLQNHEGKGIMIVGFRPYEMLEKAFDHIKML